MPSDGSKSKPRRKEANRRNPCAVCEETHGCSVGPDGFIFCRRRQGPQPGFVYLGQSQKDNQWGQYRREGDPVLLERDREWQRSRNGHHATTGSAPRTDWRARAAELAGKLTPERRGELAAHL